MEQNVCRTVCVLLREGRFYFSNFVSAGGVFPQGFSQEQQLALFWEKVLLLCGVLLEPLYEILGETRSCGLFRMQCRENGPVRAYL